MTLNLGFVALVIAGFAALYASGVDAARDDGGATEPRAADAQFSITSARDGDGSALREDAPDDLVFLEPADADDPVADLRGDSDDDAPPDLMHLASADADDAASEDEADDGAAAAAIETAEPETPATEPEPEPEPARIEVAAVETPARDPEPAPARAAVEPAFAPGSIGAMWATAGELAAELERDFPCSRFLLAADGRGQPRLQGRAATAADRDAAAARIAAAFDGEAKVELGLGCTTSIGGGYVGLTDDRGRLALMRRADLSAPVRAVLPREGACAVMGEVINLSTPVRARLESVGAPASWVRARGEPALCEYDGEAWRIVPATSGERRAGVVLLGDDVLASEVRSAAGVGVGDASGDQAREAAERAAETAEAAEVEDESRRDLRQVVPLDGPAPHLPDGVAPTADGYAVAVAFTVGEDGGPADLSVLGAGMAPVSVVAAALDVVAASRFAPPTGGADSYRAMHTVRFPSAEFSALLDRLATSTGVGARRDASPVWQTSITKIDMDRAYPRRALDRGIAGDVTLSCTVRVNGRLVCEVADEAPAGWGFGGAALQLAQRLRAADTMSDGGPSAGADINVEFGFQTEDR